MLLLDSSLLYALFKKNCAISSSLFDHHQLIINNYILAEFLIFIQKHYSLQKAIRARNLLLSDQYLNLRYLDQRYHDLACDIMNKNQKSGLNFIDCLVLAHARLDDLTLATLNPEMKRSKLVKKW